VSPSEAFAGRTGKGIRVAVIDSGVHAAHPHIGGVAGGLTIGDKVDENNYTDVIGHGTAVMAAIKEKAPDAEYFAVRVFYTSLLTTVDLLLRAIEWSIDNGMDVVNLSLGTTNPAHRERFTPVIARALENGLILVSARNADGTPALPGRLAGVIGVELDWDCPRDIYYCKPAIEGLALIASGYPRPLPGVPPAKNLQGISFAVANATGFVVRACESLQNRSYENIRAAMAANAGGSTAC
jgi:subtilisin family serine protease